MMKHKDEILYIVYVIVFVSLSVYLFIRLDEVYPTRVSNIFWGILFVIIWILRILIEKKSKPLSFAVTFLFPMVQVMLLSSRELHQRLVDIF